MSHTTLTEEDFIPRSRSMYRCRSAMSPNIWSRNSLFWNHLEKENEKPLFAEKNLNILSMRILGKNRNTLKMQVRSQHGTVMDALYFGDIEQILTYIMQKHGRIRNRKMFPGAGKCSDPFFHLLSICQWIPWKKEPSDDHFALLLIFLRSRRKSSKEKRLAARTHSRIKAAAWRK